MKKFLSLVMTLAMAVSLFAFAAPSAEAKSFPDDNEIQYKEAVEKDAKDRRLCVIHPRSCVSDDFTPKEYKGVPEERVMAAVHYIDAHYKLNRVLRSTGVEEKDRDYLFLDRFAKRRSDLKLSSVDRLLTIDEYYEIHPEREEDQVDPFFMRDDLWKEDRQEGVIQRREASLSRERVEVKSWYDRDLERRLQVADNEWILGYPDDYR